MQMGKPESKLTEALEVGWEKRQSTRKNRRSKSKGELPTYQSRLYL